MTINDSDGMVKIRAEKDPEQRVDNKPDEDLVEDRCGAAGLQVTPFKQNAKADGRR